MVISPPDTLNMRRPSLLQPGVPSEEQDPPPSPHPPLVTPVFSRKAQRYLLLTLFVAPWIIAVRQVALMLRFARDFEWLNPDGGARRGTEGGGAFMPPTIHTRTLSDHSLGYRPPTTEVLGAGHSVSWVTWKRIRDEGIYNENCQLRPGILNTTDLSRSQPLPVSYDDYVRCSQPRMPPPVQVPDKSTKDNITGVVSASPVEPAVAEATSFHIASLGAEKASSDSVNAADEHGWMPRVAECSHLDYLSKAAPRKPCVYTIQEGEDGVGALYSRALVAMIYAYQQGCDFAFSDPPRQEWNDGASYHVMPDIGPVYCHTTIPPTDPEPAKHKPPPTTEQGWKAWWSGLSCYATDWPRFLNFPRITESLMQETEARGGVVCRVHFNEAHRYLSLLGTQRLQGHVERAVETLRLGYSGQHAAKYVCPGMSNGLGVINVAVHIRRGDRTNRDDNDWDAPFSMNYYLNVMKVLHEASPPGRQLHFHIYTETASPEPAEATEASASKATASVAAGHLDSAGSTTGSSSRRARKTTSYGRRHMIVPQASLDPNLSVYGAARSNTGSAEDGGEDATFTLPELPGFVLRRPHSAAEGSSQPPSHYLADIPGLDISNLHVYVHANGDPARAFHCMVNAHILVLSPSSMSYVMAWLSRGVIVYPYFKLQDDLIVLNTEYALKRAVGALLWLDQEGHSFIPVLDEHGSVDVEVAARRLQALRHHRRVTLHK